MRAFFIATVFLLMASTALADGRPSKPIVCGVYSVATMRDGSKVGVCAATKEGGKPRYLRTFSEVSIVNPGTGRAESVMVGFQ